MSDPIRSGAGSEGWRDEAEEAPVKPWTREQAQALRATDPPLSPWWVVALQVVAGLVCGAVVWGFTRRGEAVWSALYGAAVVVVPAGLFARGMTKDLRGNLGAAVFGLVFWEGLKIGVTVVMLVIATKVVPALSWPVLLVTMLVCMQMNWLALLWRGRIANVESRRGRHGS